MSVNDQARREINAAIETLTRRHASSADEDEKRVIVQAIQDLSDELALLNQASLLQAASSVASAAQILEHAVAAARLGPFDGYLAAIESHLTRLNQLSGKAHARDSLESAVVPKARSKRAGKRAAATKRIKRVALESLTPGVLTSINFADLAQEYQDNFDRCEVRPDYAQNVGYYVRRLRQGQPNYQLVEDSIGVPWRFVGIIHGMECGFNFAGHLHNGDRLTARTVNVPKGRLLTGTPPFTWHESALDALRLKKLDRITDWSVPHMLYLLEAYNGFGYRRRGLPTPYLWSFSSVYEKGKFVQDGKFDPDAVSKQCGAALMLKAVMQ